jgi:hypothetical protein
MHNFDSILNTEFECTDLNESITIRSYLKELLKTLWREGEGFSGKRPFGNSGWQYEIYAALIKNGFIDGALDMDGYVEGINEKEADELIQNLIDYM